MSVEWSRVSVQWPEMYPRYPYIGVLSVSIAALQFTAALGNAWQSTLAYVLAVAFGLVIFYHGEHAVTTGSAFVNAGAAIIFGTVIDLVFSALLAIYLLGTPWDLALWQMGVIQWDSWIGIAFVFVSSFFVVGMTSALT